MTDSAPSAAKRRLAVWQSAAGWVEGAVRNKRQSTLVISAALLLGVACAAPMPHSDVIDSAQVSIAFFATLLTGEAVIFALSFSVSSGWPSLREIDRHIAFREWVVAGWLASMPAAIGLLADSAIPATYGALLFVLADMFGLFSFIRLFGLASAGGRKRLLSRTLAGALAREPASPATLQQRTIGEPVLAAYLAEIQQAAARSDGNGVRDLVDQLTAAASGLSRRAGERSLLALHLEVAHRLAKAALVGELDPVVASSAAETLLTSLLDCVGRSPLGEQPSEGLAQLAAAVLGQTSRYLAWLGSTSLILSARDVTSAAAAREMVALSVRSRERILRLVDPDPRYAAGPQDLGTCLTSPECVLAWIQDFTEFHGSSQAAGLYPVYEILTGTKFLGNYWDGDSVLTGLRDTLFGPGPAENPAAEVARVRFGGVGEFDRIWTLLSAGAIATLRDVRAPHPPELVRPEFTPDRQLLGAYLRTFASHRYFATADQAMAALTATVGCAGGKDSLWERTRAVRMQSGWTAPMPTVEPQRRLSACVLAIASRLAPLAAGEPDLHLRSLLRCLPQPVLEATGQLARRVLPGASEPADLPPQDAVVNGLRVLQLVGAHRVSAG